MSMEMPKQLPRTSIKKELDPSIESRIAWFHQMQEIQPVRYRPERNLWDVFRYEDVQQVLFDSARFSSEEENFPGILGKSDDPLQHRQLRGQVSETFTPRHMEELRPLLTRIVDELLEPAKTSGKMDIVAELTYPLPTRVIIEMFGLPLQDQERLQDWSRLVSAQLMRNVNLDNTELLHYFSDLLDERKDHPCGDPISALSLANGNGAHLSKETLISLCVDMTLAGNSTTKILLTAALYRLCQHPDLYQVLRDDPSLIPGAIEETLRYDFSSSNAWRTARHDTVLNGNEIKAGQNIVAWIGAANFDKRYFPHSEQFDISRSPNPHLTFGHGIHFCLGAPLARLEARVLLERLVAHFSELRLDPEHPVQFLGEKSWFLKSLGILFTPAGSQVM